MTTVSGVMTGVVTRDAIAHLIADRDGPRVSVYLPTHSTYPDSDQDPIRFKNLLDRAERALELQGVRSGRAMLEPSRALLRDGDFWRHQAAGLAAFISEDGAWLYRLPLSVEELVVVADQYHLKPLLQLLANDARFHVLAISQQAIRLFEATRDNIRTLDLHDIPSELRDAVGYDWKQRSLQFHTGTGGAGGRLGLRGAMFHGQGAPRDDAKGEIARYLRQVDEGVMKLVNGGVPLVLAAVDHLVPMYRAVSGHPNIMEEGIVGNPEEASARDLHREGWKLVEPHVAEERRRAAARYRQVAGTGVGTSNLKEVLGAAFDGRVDTLFVALGEHRWGAVGARSQHVEEHDSQQPGDQDLLDLAALQSFVTGAAVYVVLPTEVPGDGMVAAVLRY
jgi:hypothetical protein